MPTHARRRCCGSVCTQCPACCRGALPNGSPAVLRHSPTHIFMRSVSHRTARLPGGWHSIGVCQGQLDSCPSRLQLCFTAAYSRLLPAMHANEHAPQTHNKLQHSRRTAYVIPPFPGASIACSTNCRAQSPLARMHAYAWTSCTQQQGRHPWYTMMPPWHEIAPCNLLVVPCACPCCASACCCRLRCCGVLCQTTPTPSKREGGSPPREVPRRRPWGLC